MACYCPDELKSLLNESRVTHKSFIHFNVRSLSKHFDDIIDFFTNVNHSFSVVCFSETWLIPTDASLYGIPRYNAEFSFRENSRYGGSAIFILDNQSYIRRNDISFTCANVESVWLEFDQSFLETNNQKTIVGTIYRSPSSNYSDFCLQLEDTLDKLTSENKNILLFGDFNIDIADPISSVRSSYVNCYTGYGLESLITVPTRCSLTGSQTIIDHVLSNLTTECSAGIVNISITDHYPAFLLLKSTRLQQKHKQIKRSFDDGSLWKLF